MLGCVAAGGAAAIPPPPSTAPARPGSCGPPVSAVAPACRGAAADAGRVAALRLRLRPAAARGLGRGLLLAQLLGALGFEDAPHALVLEALRLDLLEVDDLGLGRLLGGVVGVALVLQLVLLVLELLCALLQVGRRHGVLVHRRRSSCSSPWRQLVGDDLVGRGLRPSKIVDPGAGRHVAVDGDLLGLAAQLVDIGLQVVVLGLQLVGLVVELVELDAGLGPRRGRGVGLVASSLDLGGGTRRGVVVASGRVDRGRRAPRGERRSERAPTPSARRSGIERGARSRRRV